ncbi:MAG: PEP-CTERM sorting domain-containing protein [Acidobacteria bacterium]|nr:PEP-CTERM sorting domain-containing protein [Acidobacteriota bacterium]
MKHQAIVKTALMLTVFFTVAAAAEARPVRYDDILAMASMVGQSGRPSVDLRLRSQVQQSTGSTQQVASSTNSGSPQDQKSAGAPDTATTAPATRPASLTGTEIAPPQQGAQQPNVETVELGEVQGTICDCGPIHIPGGFPKWPLIGLGAIPFFFINHGCDTVPCQETPPPPPTPTPTPPTVPEPATIFLFGTGLLAVGASARRRYARGAKNVNAREVRAS